MLFLNYLKISKFLIIKFFQRKWFYILKMCLWLEILSLTVGYLPSMCTAPQNNSISSLCPSQQRYRKVVCLANRVTKWSFYLRYSVSLENPVWNYSYSSYLDMLCHLMGTKKCQKDLLFMYWTSSRQCTTYLPCLI